MASTTELRRQLKKDIYNSLASSTSKVYKKLWSEFKQFRSQHLSCSPGDATLDDIALYVVHLRHNRNLASASIRSHLSAISFNFKLAGSWDPTKSYKINLILKGYTKEDGVATRKPITKSLLDLLLKDLSHCNCTYYEKCMFSVIYYLMYYAALRVSEVCMSKTSKHMLRYNCVELVLEKRIIRLKLLSCKHSSKPSPLIEVKCTKKIIRLYNLYLSLRPNKNGPFFINENGLSITRPQLVKVLKSQLTHLNYDATLYNTHSFRIGRASDMATEGYSENQIAMVGRWNSDAYKRYIKPDRITCI